MFSHYVFDHKYCLVAFIVALLVAPFHKVLAEQTADHRVEQVVGGAEATKGQFPFMAQVNYLKNPKPGHSCGGVLIHPKWVLSAAHCFQESETREIVVVLGAHSELKEDASETTRQKIQTIRKLNHPNGKFRNWGGPSPDLILFELEHPVTVNSWVRPIDINVDTAFGYTGKTTAVGWGATCRGCRQSPVLKFVTVDIVGNSNGGIVAGADNSFQTICSGDSGGPWVKDDKLIGITSVSFSYDCSGRAGLADVARYADWINSVTSGSGGANIPPSISVRGITVDESGGAALVPVELSAIYNQVVNFRFATLAGTATQGRDFYGTLRDLKFMPGETRITVPVTVIDDGDNETDETLTARIFDINNADFFNDSSNVTIIDDDNDGPIRPVQVSLESISVRENAGAAELELKLSKAATTSVSVRLHTSPTTAEGKGVDFRGFTKTITFAPGQVALPVSVEIIDDTTVESDEMFRVVMSEPSGLEITDNSAEVVITDNDTGEGIATLVLDDSSVSEGSGSVELTVRLSKALSDAVTVNIATAADTANPGSDYYGVYRELTIPPGQLSTAVDVTILNDSAIESDEQIATRIFNASSNVTIARENARLTITDDD